MLVRVLEAARDRGFLGPGPVEAHLDSAEGFGEAVLESGGPPDHAADLGSGGGVPGLPLALRFEEASWALVESAVRRAAFLRAALVDLDLVGRVAVLEGRAEVVGRRADYRGSFDLVVARSFGPPAVVAECAASLLCPGGRAVVSEPPGGLPARWASDGLARLGMALGPTVPAGGWTYQVLVQAAPCPDRYPRRVGVPAKRPLF